MASTKKLAGDVKDVNLAAKGKLRIEWANQWMPVLQTHPQAFHQGAPARGRADFRLFARDHRDREPGHYLA